MRLITLASMNVRAKRWRIYSLVSDLEERRKINSLLFFTGTPHRGKDFGFFGLMHLVRPDLFDPDGDKSKQLSRLPDVMIRNNKAAVTDLQGNRIFKPVNVYDREFSYSADEALFYRTLSEFILDGRAYAATLDGRAQTARMLVLITHPKARSRLYRGYPQCAQESVDRCLRRPLVAQTERYRSMP